MLKLRKTIDFNLLGEESEADRGSGVMDLEDDLSEENVEKDVLDDNQTDKCRNEWRGRTQCPR